MGSEYKSSRLESARNEHLLLTNMVNLGTDDNTNMDKADESASEPDPADPRDVRLVSAGREEEAVEVDTSREESKDTASIHRSRLQQGPGSEQTLISEGDLAFPSGRLRIDSLSNDQPDSDEAQSEPSRTASTKNENSAPGSTSSEKKAAASNDAVVPSYESSPNLSGSMHPASAPASISLNTGKKASVKVLAHSASMDDPPHERKLRTMHSHPLPKVIVTSTPIALPPRQSTKPKSGSLRRGKWTVEEEAYVARVIQDFNSGFLDAPAGTTLRTYLSEKLQCDPMRITKKFTGEACIGKRVFHPSVRNPSNAAAIDKAQVRNNVDIRCCLQYQNRLTFLTTLCFCQSELEQLEKRWLRRLEMQQRESARKAAASASAGLVRSSMEGLSSGPGTKATGVVQTASWLDRAKSALQDPTPPPIAVSVPPPSSHALESHMHEVQRLINEGPVIQETSAGLSTFLDEHDGPSPPGSVTEPADKRLRTAEGAEALVGFIRSVRASAAAGDEM